MSPLRLFRAAVVASTQLIYELVHSRMLIMYVCYGYYEVRFDLTDTLFLSNKIRARTYYQVY